jgi:DNA-binding NtrC family response regulator
MPPLAPSGKGRNSANGGTILVGENYIPGSFILNINSLNRMEENMKIPILSRHVQTLLVVLDEILVRFPICAYLRECGFKVIEAVNAEEAMSILTEPALTVDSVVSDIDLSGSMDGFALAQWMRREKPGLPIILAATPARAADVAADLCESGPLLAKPYDAQILLDRIKRSLPQG